MAQNIYKQELHRKLLKLRELKKTAYGEKLILINQTIDIICDILYPEKSSKYAQTPYSFLETEFYTLKDTSFLWNDIRAMAKHASSEQELLGSNIDIRVRLSKDELFTLVHDFYKNATNQEIFYLFLKQYKERGKLVYIFRNPKTNFKGDSVFLPYFQENYIRLNRNSEFANIPLLAHEYAHGIQSLINFDLTFFDSFFQEVVSIFFELICMEYYANNGEFRDAAKVAQWDQFDSRTYWSVYLTEEFNFIKQVKKNARSNRAISNNILKYIKENKATDIHNLMDAEASSDFKYVVGTMLAIELFMVYLKDRDYAFYLLDKLMELDFTIPQNEYYEQIKELGIKPAANLGNYETYLRRKFR